MPLNPPDRCPSPPVDMAGSGAPGHTGEPGCERGLRLVHYSHWEMAHPPALLCLPQHVDLYRPHSAPRAGRCPLCGLHPQVKLNKPCFILLREIGGRGGEGAQIEQEERMRKGGGG